MRGWVRAVQKRLQEDPSMVDMAQVSNHTIGPNAQPCSEGTFAEFR